jgi:hypothetical protein
MSPASGFLNGMVRVSHEPRCRADQSQRCRRLEDAVKILQMSSGMLALGKRHPKAVWRDS